MNESKPTSFPSFKRNALAAFDLEPHPNDPDKAIKRTDGVRFQLKADPGIISPYYKLGRDDKDKARIKFFKTEFVNYIKNTYKQFSNIRMTDVDTLSISENDPRISNNKLSPNVVPTNMQRVSNYAINNFRGGDYNNALDIRRVLASGATTVNTVLKQLKREADPSKYPYYSSLLGHLIHNAGKGFSPVVLIDDFPSFKRAGFVKHGAASHTELINDFGEVAGPVGLICASINGNAVRMLPHFFRHRDGSTPTLQDLMKEATIHFHASQGHLLVDSYIEYRGKIVRVSSKNAGEALSGGQGASVDGIFKSLDEIEANPEAKTAFETLLRNDPEYGRVFDRLRLVAGAFDNSELDSGMKGYVAQFKLLASLSGENADTTVTDSDVEILQALWDAAQSSDVNMHKFKHLLGAALGNRPDSDHRAALHPQYSAQVFTPQFANILRRFNLNRYGEPGTSGVEKIGGTEKYNEGRGWWKRTKKALVYHISKLINDDPKFSQLCTWILNHGAFTQIDMRYKIQDKTTLVMTNISATWPSTAVDSVKLVPLPSGDGFRYKLDINGGRGYDDRVNDKRLSAPPNDLDYSFGFRTTADKERTRKEMLPTLRDLARHSGDWATLNVTTAPNIDGRGSTSLQQPKFRGPDKIRDTRSTLQLDNFYKRLADKGYIDTVPDRNDPAARNRTALQLGLDILRGRSDEYLRDAIRFTINALWGMSTLKETDDDDDDGDVDSTVLTGAEARSARERAQRDATLAKNITNMLYLATVVNDYLRAASNKRSDAVLNGNAKYAQAVRELQQAVKTIDSGAWNAYKTVIAAREGGGRPQHSSTPITYPAIVFAKRGRKSAGEVDD